jgi:hypothetical protein
MNGNSTGRALLAVGLAYLAPHTAVAAHATNVALSQPPYVMRLAKDEFRIAFGVSAPACAARGCSGVIRYRVVWRTEGGLRVAEGRRVSYTIPAHYSRAITVDRQYLDTAEGAHTTEVLSVDIADISCGQVGEPPKLAANAAR